MIFSCTKRVRDKLKKYKKIEDVKSEPLLFNWYIDTIVLHRKTHFLFTNAQTLFSFYIYMGTNKEKDNLEKLFYEKLAEQIIRDVGTFGFYQEIFKQQLSEITYCKTNSRSIIGSMTDIKERIIYSIHPTFERPNNHIEIHNMINSTPMKNLKYSSPKEQMKKVLEAIN